MNLTLYSVLGGVLLAVAAFFYGRHVGGVEGDLKLKEEQNNEYQSYINYDNYIKAASASAADAATKARYKYQHDLTAANTTVNAASDAASKLQHAFSLYADGGWFKASPENTACVPLRDANTQLGLLAHDASILDADGLRASKGAAECAVRLTACEEWAGAVMQEFKQ